ncbi:hypothetical protein A4F85_09760 [Delftia sp. GW456-R20]|nr:hypothetical protein A4F85_09760 [Delftia sp. GW456-R20]
MSVHLRRLKLEEAGILSLACHEQQGVGLPKFCSGFEMKLGKTLAFNALPIDVGPLFLHSCQYMSRLLSFVPVATIGGARLLKSISIFATHAQKCQSQVCTPIRALGSQSERRNNLIVHQIHKGSFLIPLAGMPCLVVQVLEFKFFIKRGFVI